ncbi:hypothetical protein Tco_0527098 [Tanacetum coccineum]
MDFMEQIIMMRANDKPDSFSEADFKYLNKNDIEELYYLYRSKEIDNWKVKLMNSLITFIRSCVIWERVHDFQLGIESYQMKVNLIAPTLTFPGIEEHAPYTIVDEPQMGLIYLKSKDEKESCNLEEIVKFCDLLHGKGIRKRNFQASKSLTANAEMGIFCEWKTNSTDDEASDSVHTGLWDWWDGVYSHRSLNTLTQIVAKGNSRSLMNFSEFTLQ